MAIPLKWSETLSSQQEIIKADHISPQLFIAKTNNFKPITKVTSREIYFILLHENNKKTPHQAK